MTRSGAIVLAGGGSRRMGRDKNWLDAGGIPLLTRVVDVVASVCPTTAVVASLDRTLPLEGCRATRLDDHETDYGQGPLQALAHGLRWLTQQGAERAFVASNDLALVTPRHIRFVLGALEELEVEVDAIVPVDDSVSPAQWHPLAAAVRVGPVGLAAARLVSAGERRLLALFELIRVRTVGRDILPDPAILMPCNTPEEWEAIRRHKGWE